jgi:hypothetical protein
MSRVRHIESLLCLCLFPGLVACASGEDYHVPDKADEFASDSPDRIADLPFYFSVPRSSATTPIDPDSLPYPTLWNPSLESDDLALRVIAVQQDDGLEARKEARREMARELAAAGVLQDGDIVLSFRPELAGTMAYPHIQMGITHAGLVFTRNGQAFNIDSPLDAEHVGQFDALHYAGGFAADGTPRAGTDSLHVVRPRAMDETRRAQLRDWIGEIERNIVRFNHQRGQVRFQSNYLTPIYDSLEVTTRQTVTMLGQIILEADTTTLLPMYCSEFAWHMIALSNCTFEEILDAPPEGADCVDPPFEALSLAAVSAADVGIGEGPLLALMQMPPELRLGLIPAIFEDDNPGKLSSGHRKVADEVKPLMEPLMQLYEARASGFPIEVLAPSAQELNSHIVPNYSPTAFLIASMVEDDEGRAMDYVATIGFVNPATFAKAAALAAADAR